MLTIVPAYGRDYKSLETVINDLRANRDFIVHDIGSTEFGRYVNLAAMRDVGIHQVRVRHGGLRRVSVINIDEI
jgi:hypothetical protein